MRVRFSPHKNGLLSVLGFLHETFTHVAKFISTVSCARMSVPASSDLQLPHCPSAASPSRVGGVARVGPMLRGPLVLDRLRLVRARLLISVEVIEIARIRRSQGTVGRNSSVAEGVLANWPGRISPSPFSVVAMVTASAGDADGR